MHYQQPADILQGDDTQTKVLKTQKADFRGSKHKLNEFEHLLLNHLRPHQQRITEKNNLHYFPCLLRYEGIEFWQTLRINSESTFRDVLLQFKQKIAQEDFKEVSKYKWNQLPYDSSIKSFAEIGKTWKRQPNRHLVKRPPNLFRTVFPGNYRYKYNTNFPSQGRPMQQSRRSKHSNKDVSKTNN